MPKPVTPSEIILTQLVSEESIRPLALFAISKLAASSHSPLEAFFRIAGLLSSVFTSVRRVGAVQLIVIVLVLELYVIQAAPELRTETGTRRINAIIADKVRL